MNIPIIVTMLVFIHFTNKIERKIEDGIEKNRAFKRTRAGKELLHKKKVLEVTSLISIPIVMYLYGIVISLLVMRMK